MQTLTYVLRFHRGPNPNPKSKSDGPQPQAIAQSLQMTTVLDSNGVTATSQTVPGDIAVMTNSFALDNSGQLFFEWGTITFLGSAGSTLAFSSIGAGTLLGPPNADGFSHGVVMWKVDSGTGAFAGATGAITSNFLVNLDTEELIDNQLHLIYLP